MRSLTPDQLLSTTRAVRRRLDLIRPVDPAVVTECLELALQAPSGGNQQDWKWLVVTDPAIRAEAARIYRDASREPFAAALAGAADDGVRHAYEGAQYLAHVLHRVPVLVLPCVARRADPPTSNSYASLFGSIVPAVWSFQLALRSRGLGSTYTTVHLRREAEMAELLGIPQTATQVALLPVGYTTGTRFRPARRRSVGEVAFRDHWGTPWR